MALLDDATDVVRSRPELALAPLLVTFLSFDKLARAASARVHFGVKFPFPPALGTLWSFVSLPNTGGGVQVSVFGLLALVVSAIVAAGFLGAVASELGYTDRSALDAAFSRALPVLGVQIVTFVVGIAVFLPALVFPPLFVIVFPASILVGYLFYGAPYLAVLDRGTFDALSESADRALGGGRYFEFGVAYFALAVAASIPLTFLATNAGVIGVVLAAALVAYPSYLGSAATMVVVAEPTE